MRRPIRLIPGAAAVAALALAAVACGSPGSASTSSTSAPYKVGLVYSRTGPLAAYGVQYIEGFRAGLAYATGGTGKIGGRKVDVTEEDDAGTPATGVSEVKTLIGQGYKVFAGTVSSEVAVLVAPLAAQNRVLYISGPAAADAITGVNRYTFRSGRQTYQDILTADALIGKASGKKIVVFAQDDEFGHANVTAIKQVLGGQGASVGSVLVPDSATDFTPFASKVKSDHADLVFVAWAGTTAASMWNALNQQGVLDSTKVVTGYPGTAGVPLFGAAGPKISFLAHYVPNATSNPAAEALASYVGAHHWSEDLFDPDGFTAAQMIVHALQRGGDVNNMISSLTGWTFTGVKGQNTIRASDHALLQPMFTARLTGTGAQRLTTLSPQQVAPPVVSMKAG